MFRGFNLEFDLACPRYIEYAMDPTLIRTQDFFTVINYMASNRDANRYLWDWTRANYDELVDRYYRSFYPTKSRNYFANQQSEM